MQFVFCWCMITATVQMFCFLVNFLLRENGSSVALDILIIWFVGIYIYLTYRFWPMNYGRANVWNLGVLALTEYACIIAFISEF